MLCEAAGYDVIIVETVGVGQSETTVSKLVDIMLLLTITGAGDQLQAIKRGIIELSHLIIVTKDDGENKNNAKQTLIELKNILSIKPPVDEYWVPKVLKCSSEQNTGIDEINIIVNQYIQKAKHESLFNSKRKKQEIFWIEKTIKEEIGNIKFQKLKKSKQLKQIVDSISTSKKTLIEVLNNI